MGNPPCLQPKFQWQALVERPSLLGTHPVKPRAGGVTSRGQAVLRPNSIWQTMPIGNQCPSLGGFNFMVVCTNLQPLMGRAELRAASQDCSNGVWCLHSPSINWIKEFCFVEARVGAWFQAKPDYSNGGVSHYLSKAWRSDHKCNTCKLPKPTTSSPAWGRHVGSSACGKIGSLCSMFWCHVK